MDIRKTVLAVISANEFSWSRVIIWNKTKHQLDIVDNAEGPTGRSGLSALKRLTYDCSAVCASGERLCFGSLVRELHVMPRVLNLSCSSRVFTKAAVVNVEESTLSCQPRGARLWFLDSARRFSLRVSFLIVKICQADGFKSDVRICSCGWSIRVVLYNASWKSFLLFLSLGIPSLECKQQQQLC